MAGRRPAGLAEIVADAARRHDGDTYLGDVVAQLGAGGVGMRFSGRGFAKLR